MMVEGVIGTSAAAVAFTVAKRAKTNSENELIPFLKPMKGAGEKGLRQALGGRDFGRIIGTLFLAIILVFESLSPTLARAQDERAFSEPPSSLIIDLFNGPEYLVRALLMGISPDNQNEFGLIRLSQARELMKDNESYESKPIPVAIIDLSEGRKMPTVLTKNMALDNHGTSMANILHQVAGERAEIWTISAGFKADEADYNMAGIGKAFQYAVREGARVIMVSLSGDGSNEAQEAIKEALDKGVIVVMAVGNDGLEDMAILPSYDERVLMVGSVLGNGERAPESNFGKTIEGLKVADIFAPGRLIVTFPDGKKDLVVGTSFTPPVVGGLAVLLLSINNDLSGSEVANIIEETARENGAGLPVIDFFQAVRKVIPMRKNSSGTFSPSTFPFASGNSQFANLIHPSTPSTLSRFWKLFSDNGPLDHILRLAKWESSSLPVAMGLAVGAHFLLGASLGWAFGVAVLAGALGAAHWFGTYAVVGGKLQEVRGQNSLGKALSWFLWTSAFGVSLYLLGIVLPQDLVAFGLFLGTWIGTSLGVKGHGLSNREWVVNNIPDLTDAQRVIAREILRNLDGRPITLDMNQMRELVLHTAENVGKRKDSGAIDLFAPTALSSSGIKFMIVSQASLTAKGLENLRTMMDKDDNVFVLSEAPIQGISKDRTVIVPFGALPQGQRGNLPFREVLLAEVRSRIDALAQDHPLRRRSSDAVSLFHTADLQLNGEGLEPDDPLTEAAKTPLILLLESFRAFPLFNQAWQNSLKALRALAEFA